MNLAVKCKLRRLGNRAQQQAATRRLVRLTEPQVIETGSSRRDLEVGGGPQDKPNLYSLIPMYREKNEMHLSFSFRSGHRGATGEKYHM